jgi:hypothetical protein
MAISSMSAKLSSKKSGETNITFEIKEKPIAFEYGIY